MATVFPQQQLPTNKQVVSVAISTAASAIGDICDLGGLQLTAVGISTVWTSAVMTFRAGNSTATMAPLFSSTGGEYALTCTSSQTYWVDPDIFRGFRYIAPVSGNSTTVVAQTTATTVYFHVAPVHTLPR